ncbi:replicative DNA helicase [soil metagenome]
MAKSRFIQKDISTIPNDNYFSKGNGKGIDVTPPQALDLEINILGAILIDNDVLNKIQEILDVKYFYSKKNSFVYQAILNLSEKAEPVDPVTLIEELKKIKRFEEIGGADYIMDLINSVSTSANSVKYSQIVYEKFLLRSLITICADVTERALDPTSNTYTILDEADKQFLDVSSTLSKKKIINVGEQLDSLVSELAARREEKFVTGVPTGYSMLDDMTGGFQDSELIIIAGRPSHGKTAFAMNIARNASILSKKNIGIFSLEMSFKELLIRMLSTEAKINGQKLKIGKSTSEEWNKLISTYHKLKTNIFIDDSSSLSIFEIRAKARRMKKENNIDMIIVDYLQLVKGPESSERRDLEVGYVSRGLKALAKELEIPVVACAQLNRGIEGRGKEKMPVLSDLRESGSIEQDADVVIFVHRPIMGMKVDPMQPDYEEIKRKAEIIIGKQRNGPTGQLPNFIFLSEYALFAQNDKAPAIDMSEPEHAGF